MRYRFAAVVFAALTACAIPGSAGDLEPLDAEALQDTLTELIATHPTAKRTNVALKVTDLETGEVLFDQNSDKLYTPASNLKIYTSAAALDLLGPDYRWTTRVAIRDTGNQRLDPSIHLIAGGDPMLDTSQLISLATQLKHELGRQHEFKSLVMASDHAWSEVPLKGPGWMWDDDPDYYNMSIAQIMLNFNVLNITFEALAEPDFSSVDLWEQEGYSIRYDPSSTYPPRSIDSLAAMGLPQTAHTDSMEITRDDFEHEVLFNGRLKPGSDPVNARINVHSPRLFATAAFKRILENTGVQVGREMPHIDGNEALSHSGPATGHTYTDLATDYSPDNDKVVLVVVHKGKTNTEAVKQFLKVSENAVGEMLLLTLSEKFGEGEKVSWPSGAKVISDWLVDEAGLEEGSFRLVDGSGLSRYNLISADSSIRLLAYMKNESEHFEPFFDGLPIYKVALPKDAGAKWGGVPIAEFDAERVFAKPGGMSGVSTISGYVHTLDGRWLAFSLLGNGYIGSSAPVRDLRNQVWAELVRYQAAEAAVPAE
ncbi:MAG: D-alanyl-D-alanine carboxypeptidase [Planctomycetota bacterium]